jgi:hypothetical protein
MGEAPQVTQARRSIAFVVRNRNSAANFLAGPNTSPSDIETLHSPELSVVMTTSNHGELKEKKDGLNRNHEDDNFWTYPPLPPKHDFMYVLVTLFVTICAFGIAFIWVRAHH